MTSPDAGLPAITLDGLVERLQKIANHIEFDMWGYERKVIHEVAATLKAQDAEMRRLLQLMAAEREKALEEAAKVADAVRPISCGCGRDIAAAIRALSAEELAEIRAPDPQPPQQREDDPLAIERRLYLGEERPSPDAGLVEKLRSAADGKGPLNATGWLYDKAAAALEAKDAEIASLHQKVADAWVQSPDAKAQAEIERLNAALAIAEKVAFEDALLTLGEPKGGDG